MLTIPRAQLRVSECALIRATAGNTMIDDRETRGLREGDALLVSL